MADISKTTPLLLTYYIKTTCMTNKRTGYWMDQSWC